VHARPRRLAIERSGAEVRDEQQGAAGIRLLGLGAGAVRWSG
jgi:hypothetical protein